MSPCYIVTQFTLSVLFFSFFSIAMADMATNRHASPSSVTTLSHHGITWTFSRPVEMGTFVTGDPYVLGPVTVVDVDPRPLRGREVPESERGQRERARVREDHLLRNGSMVNPPARREVALDSGIRNYYHPPLDARLPITLNPGDLLLSSISLLAGEEVQFPYHGAQGSREHRDNSPLRSVSLLTCLGSRPDSDAFRPSYGDPGRTLYYSRQLRRHLLPRLPPPPRTPDLNLWIRVFERPWFNPCFFGFEQPMEHMPQYGQWIGQAQSIAGLLLLLDLDPKAHERLLLHVVQVGIDYWGLVRQGHPGWNAHGGHGSGRKFPIVFAGLLLGDTNMASPTRAFPKVEFGEDNQTMFGSGWMGATALFAGHSGISRATGRPPRPQWGPYEHLHPSQWQPGDRQSEAYRRANTSRAWVGQALSLEWLQAQQAWNHDPFFAYVHRWMQDPHDATHRTEIMRHHPSFRLDDQARHTHQGQAGDPFVQAMWERYHPLLHTPSPPPAPRP